MRSVRDSAEPERIKCCGSLAPRLQQTSILESILESSLKCHQGPPCTILLFLAAGPPARYFQRGCSLTGDTNLSNIVRWYITELPKISISVSMLATSKEWCSPASQSLKRPDGKHLPGREELTTPKPQKTTQSRLCSVAQLWPRQVTLFADALLTGNGSRAMVRAWAFIAARHSH